MHLRIFASGVFFLSLASPFFVPPTIVRATQVCTADQCVHGSYPPLDEGVEITFLVPILYLAILLCPCPFL